MLGVALTLTQCRKGPSDPDGSSGDLAGCAPGLALTGLSATAAMVGVGMWIFTGDIDLDVIVIDESASLRVGPTEISGTF